MATRKINPTSPGQRGMTRPDFAENTTQTTEKSLLKTVKKNGGRNNKGRNTKQPIRRRHKNKKLKIEYKT